MKKKSFVSLKKGIIAAALITLVAGANTVTAFAAEEDLAFVSEAVSDASMISLASAKKAALKHANLQSSQVTYTKAKKEKDDGVWVYDIEFYDKSKNQYEYEVDAYSKKILSYKKKLYRSSSSTSVKKTLAQAKSAALKHANLSGKKVTYTKTKLEKDDGVWEYDIQFTYGKYKYEYEINASNAAVISFEKKKISSGSKETPGAVTLDEAKAIALAHAKLTGKNVYWEKAKRDYEYGQYIYELEFKYNGWEYEYDISEKDGEIISWEKDFDD